MTHGTDVVFIYPFANLHLGASLAMAITLQFFNAPAKQWLPAAFQLQEIPPVLQ